jgi:hypothetical protein
MAQTTMRSGWRAYGEAALLSLRAHLVILIIPLTFLAVSTVLTAGLDDPQRAPVLSLIRAMLTVSLPAALVALFFVRLFQYAVYIKPDSAIRQLGRDIRWLVTTPALYINALPAVTAMIIHNKAAIEMKASIPAINPFAWDTFFAGLDRTLHFGIDPWRLLQPVLGHAPVTFVINNFYNFWFLLMFGMWFWFAFQSRHSELRDRFFIAFTLMWFVCGGIMAMVFSSAGPVYYSNLGLSPNPFTGLMAYLHDVHDNVVPIWALNTQQYLWDGYTGVEKNFLGISAFPSMHNAVVTMFVCAAWQVNRRFGKLVAVYAFIILIGSVHLGWHYALDSYAGIALGLAFWWLAGFISRWHARQPWVIAYAQSLKSLSR